MFTGNDIREVVGECTSFVRESLDDDWTVAVPDLDMSVGGVLAHASLACMWYSIDLAAQGKDLPTIDPNVTANGSASDIVDTMSSCASLLAAMVDVSPASQRGFHPFGETNPSGFAAMACDELLVHSYDAGLGLGRTFVPSGDHPQRLVKRLFPWVEPGDDVWQTLLWANGRIELDGKPRQSKWKWHCSPLDEWDGEIPS